MRSGSLLLFTLIPSSILAASPIPVKSPEFTPAIASGLSSAVPPVSVCLQPVLLYPLPTSFQKNPTVTLLDGETGEISNTGTFPSPQLQYSLTQTIFVDVFRMPQKSMEKSMKPIYKGLYNPLPPKRRKWIYFKITGFPGCPTEEHPCFGWMAMGREYLLPDLVSLCSSYMLCKFPSGETNRESMGRSILALAQASQPGGIS
ncbi:hypothetical protein BDP27DRAFT_102953 [Rhodocollybia butyracea]|uniref:Uncharacterized protein n=1 Tax=Rhodocollybia butyracea TaxID=206335 RepID=A0A9P5PNB2_9AGAR|nr:hypothetical protein BDP27DRAFT_102953 [Rhodocollybia butyracea]